MAFSSYFRYLPIAVVPSIFYAVTDGIKKSIEYNRLYNRQTNNKYTLLENIVGYASIGVLVGFTYPISFPIIFAKIIYDKKRN